MSGWSYIPVFAFLFVKIVTRGQLGQQLVKPVIRTCFHFFNREISNAEAAVLSGRSHVPVFAFPLEKIVTRGQLC